jgi:hydroxyacyl-ACP dehydratase HTD2-like protein with hotdog domain
MIDPAVAGTVVDEVRFPVERGKLAELARAFHETDPAWHDDAAARAAGFAAPPCPPTASALLDHWRPGGALAPALAIGADLERLLHGEAEWTYYAPLASGDELTASTRVVDVATREGRRGGAMTLVTVETALTNQDGDLAVRRRDVLIETGDRT